MAKYLSVEEVADILGKTDRTVRRMLNAGLLQGSQHQDKGKLVWRVHATKDLIERLERKAQQSPFENESETIAIEASDTSAVEDVSDVEFEEFRTQQKQTMKAFADELIRPLADKIADLSMLLGEKDKEIEEKNRQLRLLPDLERQAKEERLAAEKERQIAEAKMLEVAALNKQIEALLADKAQGEATVAQAQQLSEQLSSMQHQIEDLKRPFWKKLFGGK